jgi:hypothetical protein
MNTFTFMFKEDSFIISETLKQDVLQYKNEKINCGNPYNGILQGYKEISYQAMGKHGGKLNYYKMKEASVKRLYTDDSSI